MALKRLGDLLIEQGAVTPQQLAAGLSLARASGNRLGAALVAQGVLTEERLVQALSAALSLPRIELEKQEVDWSALHALRDRFCEANDLFPVSLEAPAAGRKVLTVAMADPLNLPAVEEIEFTTGYKVAPRLATLSQVRGAIRKHYQRHTEEKPRRVPERPSSGEVVLGGEPIDDAAPAPEIPPVRKPEITGRTELAELIRAHEAKARARPKSGSAEVVPAPLAADLGYLLGETLPADPYEHIESLERKLWALLRLMARKGVLTREEFLDEFGEP